MADIEFDTRLVIFRHGRRMQDDETLQLGEVVDVVTFVPVMGVIVYRARAASVDTATNTIVMEPLSEPVLAEVLPDDYVPVTPEQLTAVTAEWRNQEEAPGP